MALFGNKKTVKSEPKNGDSQKEKAVKPRAMSELYESAPSGGAKDPKSGRRQGEAHRILIRPLVTEKSAHLNSVAKYVFVVSEIANKISVARAIEEVYGVKPSKVNLSNIAGKKVVRGRIRGQRRDWRKAVVTLAAGQTIKIYEGV